ncbi:MAG: ChaN family lipoprotein [Ferruginibacter sp.]|nr:ChaN family lipoprotein [Cytophagales bacterium]
MKTFALLACSVGFSFAFTADKPAYRLFDQAQKEVLYRDVIRKLSTADVVLFGEIHNNPVCHWLELQVTKDLYTSAKGRLVLGAEMFEADDQLVVDEYLKGLLTASQLEAEAKVWDNFRTDYRPLLDFALAKQLSFVATNVPRRYASLVARNDLPALDGLNAEAKKWIAPLPVTVDLTLPGYANMLQAMGGSAHGGSNAANLAKAQAIKDATMAHFIRQNRKAGQLFLHYNGAYHSNHYEGIGWYLKQQDPSLKIVTISSVEQEDIGKLEEANYRLADFTVCIPADMTKTH